MRHLVRPLLRRSFRLAGALALASVAFPLAAAPTVVMKDDFSSRASGWHHKETSELGDLGISVYTPSGAYQLTPIANGTLGISLAPRQAQGANVEVEAKTFLYAGIGKGAAGLVCRYEDFENFYAFIVTGGQGWVIAKTARGKTEPLAQGGPVPSVMPGAVDVKLSARCDGDVLALYVDGKKVGEARDAALAKGRSGLVVIGETMAGTHAMYDDFALRALAD